MNQPLSIAICGLGTVAQGVLDVLKRNSELISARAGRPIQVVRVASRSEKPGIDLLGASFSTDIAAAASDPAVDVVVELIGGESRADELVRDALARGKHVVTANKAIIAAHGDDYLQLARSHDVAFGFEAAVAGGIPIIGALTRGLAANDVKWLAGIINGTSNYILTAMAATGQSFEDALNDAQSLGYAEADPTFDVGGIDAAHKLTILASLAFAVGFRFDDVYTEGIEQLEIEDIEYARQLGYVIKHLGIARRGSGGIEMRVHPTLIPEKQLLASVDGVMNAVMINGDAAGDTLYYGAGAGGDATASAIIADLIEVARDSAPAWLPSTAEHRGETSLAISDIESAYYLNIPSLDKPGVFAQAATILSDLDISIEAVIQKEQAIHLEAGQPWVPIVILTHCVRERVMDLAIAQLEALPEVIGSIKRIRVEQFASA